MKKNDKVKYRINDINKLIFLNIKFFFLNKIKCKMYVVKKIEQNHFKWNKMHFNKSKMT